MRRIIRIVILLVVLAGCRNGNDRVMQQLAQVDTLLVHELVDSAWHEINRIDTAEMGDDVRAYYQLLRVQTMWKAYIPVTSDSLLDFSLDYYRQHGPQNLLARTYYYIGAVQKESGKTNDAVESLKQAELLASQASDKLLQSKVYNSLEDINFAAGDFATALQYAQMAVDCCRGLGNPKLLVEDYEVLAVAWHHAGEPDSALYYFEQCLPLIDHVRKEEQAHVLANLGVYYKSLGFPQRAEELLQRSVEREPHGFAYRSLAGLYAERGDYAKAEEYYLEALRLAERLDTRVSTLRSYRELKMLTGDYSGANELASEITQLKDSMEQQRKTEGVGLQQLAFDHRVQSEQLERSRRWAWRWGAVLLALLAGAAVYYYHRKRQSDRQMSLLQQQIAENAKAIRAVQQDAEEAEGKMSELRKDNRKVKDQLLRTNTVLQQLQQKQDTAVAKMRKEYALQLSRGRILYDTLLAGGTAQTWRKQDFSDFECYYCMRDIPFAVELNEDYGSLSPLQRCCLILSHMGKSDEEVRETLGMSEGAWRTMQSRMKKLSPTPTE